MTVYIYMRLKLKKCFIPTQIRPLFFPTQIAVYFEKYLRFLSVHERFDSAFTVYYGGPEGQLKKHFTKRKNM